MGLSRKPLENMRRFGLYSAMCSCVNTALLITLVALSVWYVPRVLHTQTWWCYLVVFLIAFLAWGYVCQWLLSGLVNTALQRMFRGNSKNGQDR